MWQLVFHHCICGSGFKETCISCCLEKQFGINISVLLSIPINLNKQIIADTQILKAEIGINYFSFSLCKENIIINTNLPAEGDTEWKYPLTFGEFLKFYDVLCYMVCCPIGGSIRYYWQWSGDTISTIKFRQIHE